VRLTSDNRVTGHPAWIADGREIVFSSGNTAALSLWRMAAHQSAPLRRLAYTGDEAITPSFAPQGHRLVYTRSIFDPNIWRLTVDGPEGKAGPAVSLASSTRIESDPAYSPDGKRIAFESTRSGNYEIWVSDQEGSNAAQVTSFNGPGVGIPRWSPDSEYLAFDSSASGQYDIYIIQAAGGQLRRLTQHPADDQVPSWSTDGKWVYFASKRTGEFQIWKVAAAGGEAVQATTAGGYVPSESPDGKFLYYTKKGGLWRAPVVGGAEERVLESVDGRHYAVVNEGIYFIKRLAVLDRGPGVMGEVQFLRFSTGAIRAVFTIPKPIFVGFSVAPDGRSILYTQIDQQGTDLMLVEHFQ
jgi:Tol biopolymer transport system component